MGSGALRVRTSAAGMLWTAAGLAAGLIACAGSSSQSALPRLDGGPVCSGASGCAAGSQCTNGLCAPACADGGCAAGSYCEGSEAPRQICTANATPSCLDPSQCPNPQSCYLGTCVSLQPLADGGASPCTMLDDCGPDAMCNPVGDANGNVAFFCVAQPHCSQDGGCPSVAIGEACNQKTDGGLYFPEKERLCLQYFCAANTDCQAPAVCFHGSGNGALGGCSFGGPGAGCQSNADCPGSTNCSQRLEDGGIAREADGGPVDGGPADGGNGTCFYCNDGGTVCY